MAITKDDFQSQEDWDRYSQILASLDNPSNQQRERTSEDMAERAKSKRGVDWDILQLPDDHPMNW